MLEQISNNADIIIASVQTALTLDMLPTIWTQFRARASTVPLTSSVPTAVGLAVLGLVFFSTGLFIATGTVLVGSAMWSIVAAQRVVYNRYDGSATSTSDSDPELRSDDSRLHGSSSIGFRYTGGGCGCFYYARAGWCWHFSGPPGRSQRQATGVGVDGDSESDASPVKEVPDLVQHPSTATYDISGDRAELEKLAREDPEKFRKRIGR